MASQKPVNLAESLRPLREFGERVAASAAAREREKLARQEQVRAALARLSALGWGTRRVARALAMERDRVRRLAVRGGWPLGDEHELITALAEAVERIEAERVVDSEAIATEAAGA